MTIQRIATIVTLVTALFGLIGGGIAYDGTLAKADEVQQSLSIMAQGIQIQMDTNRLSQLNDQRYKVKRHLMLNPIDKDAQDELAYLNEQITNLRVRIETNSMNLGK